MKMRFYIETQGLNRWYVGCDKIKRVPPGTLFVGGIWNYFQPVTMVSADEEAVIPEVAAVVQPTGLDVKSPVIVMTAADATSLPSFSVATAIVQCSASAPSAMVTVCTSGVNNAVAEAALGNWPLYAARNFVSSSLPAVMPETDHAVSSAPVDAPTRHPPNSE